MSYIHEQSKRHWSELMQRVAQITSHEELAWELHYAALFSGQPTSPNDTCLIKSAHITKILSFDELQVETKVWIWDPEEAQPTPDVWWISPLPEPTHAYHSWRAQWRDYDDLLQNVLQRMEYVRQSLELLIKGHGYLGTDAADIDQYLFERWNSGAKWPDVLDAYDRRRAASRSWPALSVRQIQRRVKAWSSFSGEEQRRGETGRPRKPRK